MVSFIVFHWTSSQTLANAVVKVVIPTERYSLVFVEFSLKKLKSLN